MNSNRIEVTSMGDAGREYITQYPYTFSTCSAEDFPRMMQINQEYNQRTKCKWCGRNLKQDAEECPRCGGPNG